LAGGSFGKKEIESPEEKFKLLIKRGRTLMEEGQWAEAIAKFAIGVRYGREEGRPDWEVQAMRHIAETLTNKGDLDKALTYYDKALELAKKTGDNLGIAHIYRGLGSIHMSKGDLVSAEKNFTFFRDTAKSIGIRPMLGSAYIDMADIAMERGDLGHAIENYKKGIEVLVATEEHVELARAYNSLGNAFKSTGDYGTALTYFEKAMDTCSRYGNIHMWALTESLVAECCTKLGFVIRAMEHLESARGVLRRLEDNAGLGELYRISGVLMGSQGNWNAAEVHFEKSTQLLADQDRPIQLAHTYIELGRMMLLRNNLEKAKECFEKAMKLSIKVDSKRLQETVEKLLKELA
jgi:tetratricopeptide (TPR) repeat protein